jgi:hypothetical protein
MVSRMIFSIFLINSQSCASLAGQATTISGTSPSSTMQNNTIKDLALSTIADKSVKAIIPFLKELSEVEWWTCLLEAWINFESEGPPKSVSSIYFNLICSQLLYYSDCQLTIALVKLLYG